MRIALVSSSSGSRGGGEIYLVQLSRGLKDLGHEPHLICSTHERMDELANMVAGGIPVHRLPLANTYDRWFRGVGSLLDNAQRQRLQTTLRAIDPDIVHVNQQVSEDGIDLVSASQGAGFATLSTIHVGQSARQLGAVGGVLRDAVAHAILRQVDVPHIAVSHSSAALLGARLRRAKLHVVHNGVEIVPPDPEHVAAVRREWDAAPDDIILGSVGRIEEQKNPLFTLVLMKGLITRGISARYVWIGTGSLSDRLKAEAAGLGLDDHLVLDGWRQDAPRRAAAFDIFVLPSRFEGLPLALLEAMAAGVPACSAAVDGAAECVEDGRTGYLCPPGDESHWVDRLEHLIRDPSHRLAMGRAAADRVATEFSRRSMTEKTLSIYRELLGP